MEQKGLRELLAYMPYFEGRPEFCLSEQGPWYCYSDEMNAFAARASAELVDYNYQDTLKKYGVQDDIPAAIASADLVLLRAILTYYIRGERFCEGMWAQAAKDGAFTFILRRLQELIGNGID